MHITKLSVAHFEGLESLELEPGERLNLVEGGNGAGKTSVLEAIRVAFTNRGQRSLLVKEDHEEGLILFELSDGTEGQREVNRKGYTAGSVSLYQDEGRVGSAQSFLDSIGLGFGFNPLEFIELRADQQTEKLLEVTPVDLSEDDLIALTGEPLEGVDYDQHPLKVLDAIKAALFEMRRDVGRNARDTEGMVEKLRAKVPGDFDRESVEDFNLPEAVSRMRKSRNLRERAETLRTKVQGIDNEIESLQHRIAELYEESAILAGELEDLEENQIPKTDDPTEIEARIEVYQENQSLLQNLKQADEREVEAEALRQQYSELQEQLSEAREMPGRVLSHTELPVEDLAIEDGEVTIKGLPISELSAGEQLRVAVDIALATLGELKVVLVDGLEKLDPGNQDYLLSRLTKAGVQAFVTRIADGHLKVITDYAPGDLGVFGPDDDTGGEPEEEPEPESPDPEPEDDDWKSILDEVDGSEAPF